MHQLPNLPYPYHALEPHIDAQTMEIHHTKHHQAYINNLNKALEAYPDLQTKSIEDLLKNLSQVPEDIRSALQNHGGGHFNHALFWTIMAPPNNQKPAKQLTAAINSAFGSFEKLMELLGQSALNQFGSGWAWLAVDQNKKLQILSTLNQNSPLAQGLTPILGIDVWEHAYYLKYQNRRADYINAFWNVVNWEQVNKNLVKSTH